MDDFEKMIQSTSRALDEEPSRETPRYPPSATGTSPQGMAPNIQAQQFRRPSTPDTGPAMVPVPPDASGLSVAPSTAFDPAAFAREVAGTSSGGGEGGFMGGLKQIGYGMSEAAAETGLPFAGMLAGAVRGAPAGVPGMIAGAGTGLLAGYLGGQGLKPLIPQARPEDLPLRIMGQTIGESMAIAPTAFFLPVQTGGRIATFISKIGESARKSPGAYLTAESLTSLGAGIGAGTAEAVAPGEALPRLGGSLAGGLTFSLPSSIVQNVIDKTGRGLRAVADAANPLPWLSGPGERFGELRDSATEALRTRQYTRAANTLYDILEANKEDIPALIRALEDPGIEGIPTMTAAQKTGNKTLAGLEARLALGGKDRYAPETLKQGELAFNALRILTRRLSEVGDPEALRLAAEMRETAFNQMLQNRLTAAEADAATKIARIPRVDVAGRRELGDTVKTEVELALQNARMVEGELWRAGLLQVLKGSAVDPDAQAAAAKEAMKTAGMSQKQYDSIEANIRTNPFLREKASQSLEDIEQQLRTTIPPFGPRRSEYLSTIPTRAQRIYNDLNPIRSFLEIEALKKGTGAANPADVVPSNAAQNFLNRTKDISLENFESLPASLRNVMQGLGVNANVWNTYKNGARTVEALETGSVPQQFLPKLKAVNAVDLLSNRSELMNLARTARAQGDNNLAGIYDTVAAGLLDDIGSLNAPLLDEARAFSKALNDTFTRTYANDITAMSGRGAERMTPEMLVRRAFSPSNMDQTTARMTELRGALEFPKRQYEDALQRLGPDNEITIGLKPLAEMANSQIDTLNGAFQSVLLTAATKTMKQQMDPATGQMATRVDPAALTNFVTENKQLLDGLGLTDTLTDAVKAQNAFDLVRLENSALNKTLREQTAFAKVLAGGENPVIAVADALKGKNPVRDFAQIAKLARAGGPEAINGLKASVYEYAYDAAGGAGNFSPKKYLEILYGRAPKEQGPSFQQPSAMNIMRQNGIITLSEQKNIQRLMNPMIRIENGIENNVPLENFITGASAVEDAALRFLGINIGAAAAGSGGHALYAAGIGSRMVRQIFDQMPTLELRRMIEKASQNPEFMATLLRQGRTAREKFEIARKLNSYMISSGLTAVSSIFEEPPPPEPEPFSQPSQSSRMFRQMPPAPATRGAPGVPQGGGQPAPGPQSQAPTTQSRAMLEQLFPFDTISAMAAQQQQPPPPA
jgi:hypothetical protein